MFEKLPSLKDFIIYFIPGLLTTVFSAGIIMRLSKNSETKLMDQIGHGSTYIVVGILFSLILGFCISQVQITLFGKLMKKKIPMLRCISYYKFHSDFQKSLIGQFKKVFDCQSATDDLICKMEPAVYCYAYILEKGKSDTVQFIDRQKNLSSLAFALPIPMTTFMVYFSLLIESLNLATFSTYYWILGILVIFIIVSILFCRIWLAFIKGFHKDVFILFQII